MRHCPQIEAEEPAPPTEKQDDMEFIKPNELDSDNFAYWYQSLGNFAAILQAEEHVTSNPQPPINPAASVKFGIKKAKVRSLIMQSLPNSVSSKLDPHGIQQNPIRDLHNY